MFDDSVELHAYYIKTRDELCRNGETLLSPALSYTEHHMNRSVENLLKQKLQEEAENLKKIEEMEVDENKDVPKAAEVRKKKMHRK